MSYILKEPPALVIRTDNWFHAGWLHGVFGLPQRKFDDPDTLVSDVNIDSWRDGYAMALETGFEITEVFKKQIELGQLVIKNKCGGDPSKLVRELGS